jgi:ketosteroid isomerase-like protein
MSASKNDQLLLDVFHALEQRDGQRFSALLHPDFEIHWPPSLPYGGKEVTTWTETWEPLQPTQAERKMDARIVAECGDEVIVHWRQRGISSLGERFEGEVLGLYRIRDGKLARAQMFYFDTAAVVSFLSKARG